MHMIWFHLNDSRNQFTHACFVRLTVQQKQNPVVSPKSNFGTFWLIETEGEGEDISRIFEFVELVNQRIHSFLLYFQQIDIPTNRTQHDYDDSTWCEATSSQNCLDFGTSFETKEDGWRIRKCGSGPVVCHTWEYIKKWLKEWKEIGFGFGVCVFKSTLQQLLWRVWSGYEGVRDAIVKRSFRSGLWMCALGQ